MKFMLNGALTLGTLDGANIEIVEEVGAENAFIFGLKAEEIRLIETQQTYAPQKYIDNNPRLSKVLEELIDGSFAPDIQLFRELHDSLVYGIEGQRADSYYVLADFAAYAEAQQKIDAAYANKRSWARKALLNIANSGKFSSDRTIEDYVRDIWKLKHISIE
jgi:starch phosphorylase